MRGFTLIELIFVLVLMGILSSIAIMYMPNNQSIEDRETLRFLILEKKSNGLNFKANMQNEKERKIVCITLSKASLNNEENHSKIKYFFKSNISVSGLKNGNLLCFDSYGRPFDGEVDNNLSNLCKENVTITLEYKGKSEHITIYKISGAVE